jgi:hypothetical protein
MQFEGIEEGQEALLLLGPSEQRTGNANENRHRYRTHYRGPSRLATV